MISHFFIDRPIFATVLSVVMTLAGGLALLALPVAQYPPITPPTVQVSINYPGASALVVADTVAAPIEQQVNGVENMLYMSSRMGNDGSYTLTVTFELGTDLNTALVMVQNRVSLAMPLLPNSVQNQGITIKKKTPDILMVMAIFSPDGRYDDIYLSNYAMVNLRDEILRVPGVSDINFIGQRDYSIRAWLDPQKLAARNMTAMDVAAAVRQQNLAAAPGQIGQPPIAPGQAWQLPLDTLGRLSTPEQFGEIIVRAESASPIPGATMAGIAGASASTSNGNSAGGATGTPPGPAGSPPVEDSAPSLVTQLQNGTLPGMTSIDMTRTAPPVAVTSSTTGTASVFTPAGATGLTGTVSVFAGASSTGGGGTTGGGATATTSQSTQGADADDSSAASGRRVGSALGSGQVHGSSTISGPRRPSDAIIRLRDVARIEMGAQNYNQSCTFDGRQAVGLAIYQLPGTNALDVADAVKLRVKQLSTRFPEGVDYAIPYDTTPFIRESVAEVVRTLFEAIVLVALVVLAFLQNWRAVLIPLAAVPVAIVGTFSVMAALRFSLNNISLFGLVLAIGIVVDDAIVVVENVERWLEEGLSPRDAARKAMDEVTGPVIAVALVLCAVFVPCAFISGITGQFFRQFAVTIAVSTVISAFNSLTLSPALAAILLKPHSAKPDILARVLAFALGWFFRLFNATFGRATAGYAWAVGRLARGALVVGLVYGGLLFLTFRVFGSAPTGFVPEQDQGRLIVNVQLPDSASLEWTQQAMSKVSEITRNTPGVAHAIAISGISFVQSANSSNFGSMFVILKPFDERRSPDLKDTAIMARLRRAWRTQVEDAQVVVFGAPAIPGLSVAGGFRLMVEDRAGMGPDNLQRHTDGLTAGIAKMSGLSGVSTQFRSNTPQLFMDIDRTKVQAMGISLDDVNQTLQIFLGSLYVNSFNAFGRYWQVNLQAEGVYRDRVDKINLLEVRNRWGGMVPLGTLTRVRQIGGPVFLTRYNLAVAAPITGNVLPQLSTGTAIDQIEALAERELPRSMLTEWTELMFMQIRAGNTAIYVFAFAVACVFLALAALYESWSLPLAVILVVPLCLLCSVVGVLYSGSSVNIFVQIGLVVLVGLACKNAILIVEFARELRGRGQPVYEATVEASRLRLRPILMTSFAFILGVVPLVTAQGAGAEMRRSLGTAVFSGMLGVTLFGIFLTPVFFYVIQGLSEASLFSARSVRWVGSLAIAGGLAMALGWLVTRVRPGTPAWLPLATAPVGIFVGALAIGRMESRKARIAGTVDRGPSPDRPEHPAEALPPGGEPK
ncbi:efflux RND transporter permease subunit [Aquisphaera insulae]|uniref:efflux RND transporter permease subunit n=1 Tax=Aquisphaera insulae TaxID=2712864 RepID=UPI0013EAEF5B|nr:efflux RND transporter permease subunit [Aquisphaera insulae]